MKEDILEQVIKDWLVSEPRWFTKHYIKVRSSKDSVDYRSKQDSVYSDIDILAISGTKTGRDRVRVLTCKSWQGGFDPSATLKVLESDAEYHALSEEFQPREKWKYYRELVSPKWLRVFVDKNEEETGKRDFEFCIAVTKLLGKSSDIEALENSEIIRGRIAEANLNLSLKFITLEEIVQFLLSRQSEKQTAVFKRTDLGRLLQLHNAVGIRLETK